MRTPHRLSVLLLGSVLFAQGQGAGRSDAEAAKAVREDPFTLADPKIMAQAGVVAYGPMLWADNLRTEEIDRVLGENRIRWLETAHFLIGCNLAATGPVDDGEARKLQNAELQRLHKRCAKFPERSAKLDPWLRLHLFAQRAEELYAEFAELVGHADANGTFLGQKGKFPVLLFEKRADTVRYLDRFCGIKSQVSQQYLYSKTGQHGFVLSAEGDEPRDDAQVHSQFRFLLIQVFADAFGGLPSWVDHGLAHSFARQVPSRLMMAVPKDDEAIDQQTQHKWPAKMRARAQHEALLIPFADLLTKTDFGYWASVQSWSRIDYLTQLDEAKFREFLRGLGGGGSGSRQLELLDRLYGMDSAAFDQRWREWVLKTYK